MTNRQLVDALHFWTADQAAADSRKVVARDILRGKAIIEALNICFPELTNEDFDHPDRLREFVKSDLGDYFSPNIIISTMLSIHPEVLVGSGAVDELSGFVAGFAATLADPNIPDTILEAFFRQ
jgi:hypothetical protein